VIGDQGVGEAWRSQPEDFGTDPMSYRCEWRERARLRQRAATEQRQRRRKAALLAAVVGAWIVLTLASLTPMTTVKAIGLAVLEGVVLGLAIVGVWRICCWTERN
jgi:hypothetical protein